ncbi:MAG: putative diacylglycerol kinase [Puniceicoccaceae bacterium 5H]|nr:MAG: putative diacylglycerol kinase [Puniceicoccaceae bacterium 5H]
MPAKRLQIILNQRSGTLIQMDAEAVAKRITEAFEQNAWTVNARIVDGDTLKQTLQEAADDGADTILVGGGDGTIATAVEMLRGTGKTLAILPLGTMNLLAKDLGLPEDWEEALDLLIEGEAREIDVAEVNGVPFTCMSVLGVYPRISETRESLRGRFFLVKWTRVAIAGIRMLATYPLLRVSLTTVEGEKHNLCSRLIIVSNNCYDEAVLGQLPKRRALDEGQLGIYVFDSPGRWQMLWVTAALLLGWWDKVPELKSFRSKEVEIRPRFRRRVRSMTDGEVFRMKTPLHYKIEARGLKVLTAPQLEEDASCQECITEKA